MSEVCGTRSAGQLEPVGRGRNQTLPEPRVTHWLTSHYPSHNVLLPHWIAAGASDPHSTPPKIATITANQPPGPAQRGVGDVGGFCSDASPAASLPMREARQRLRSATETRPPRRRSAPAPHTLIPDTAGSLPHGRHDRRSGRSGSDDGSGGVGGGALSVGIITLFR